MRRSSPPPSAPSPNGNGWHNTDVTVTFTCSDALSGVASCPAPITVTAEGAGQVVTGTAVDKAGNTREHVGDAEYRQNRAEANISVTPAILWPPNHKMVNVAVNGGATDNTSGIASVVITVTDEYGRVQPAVTGFNTTIQLQAWRKGAGQGRQALLITAVITDKAGNKTTVRPKPYVRTTWGINSTSESEGGALPRLFSTRHFPEAIGPRKKPELNIEDT